MRVAVSVWSTGSPASKAPEPAAWPTLQVHRTHRPLGPRVVKWCPERGPHGRATGRMRSALDVGDRAHDLISLDCRRRPVHRRRFLPVAKVRKAVNLPTCILQSAHQRRVVRPASSWIAPRLTGSENEGQ